MTKTVIFLPADAFVSDAPADWSEAQYVNKPDNFEPTDEAVPIPNGTPGRSYRATMTGIWANPVAAFGSLSTPVTDISLSATSIAENAQIGSIVGVLSSTPAGATYEIVADQDEKFELSGNNLVTRALLDYEFAAAHEVTILATLDTETFEKPFTIGVTEVFTFATYTTEGTVGTITVGDTQDGNFEYSQNGETFVVALADIPTVDPQAYFAGIPELLVNGAPIDRPLRTGDVITQGRRPQEFWAHNGTPVITETLLIDGVETAFVDGEYTIIGADEGSTVQWIFSDGQGNTAESVIATVETEAAGTATMVTRYKSTFTTDKWTIPAEQDWSAVKAGDTVYAMGGSARPLEKIVLVDQSGAGEDLTFIKTVDNSADTPLSGGLFSAFSFVMPRDGRPNEKIRVENEEIDGVDTRASLVLFQAAFVKGFGISQIEARYKGDENPQTTEFTAVPVDSRVLVMAAGNTGAFDSNPYQVTQPDTPLIPGSDALFGSSTAPEMSAFFGPIGSGTQSVTTQSDGARSGSAIFILEPTGA